jgi:hypothetical protein
MTNRLAELRAEAFEAVTRIWFLHEPLKDGLGPKPLLQFLARVEDLLLEYDLL